MSIVGRWRRWWGRRKAGGLVDEKKEEEREGLSNVERGLTAPKRGGVIDKERPTDAE